MCSSYRYVSNLERALHGSEISRIFSTDGVRLPCHSLENCVTTAFFQSGMQHLIKPQSLLLLKVIP